MAITFYGYVDLDRTWHNEKDELESIEIDFIQYKSKYIIMYSRISHWNFQVDFFSFINLSMQ